MLAPARMVGCLYVFYLVGKLALRRNGIVTKMGGPRHATIQSPALRSREVNSHQLSWEAQTLPRISKTTEGQLNNMKIGSAFNIQTQATRTE